MTNESAVKINRTLFLPRYYVANEKSRNFNKMWGHTACVHYKTNLF